MNKDGFESELGWILDIILKDYKEKPGQFEMEPDGKRITVVTGRDIGSVKKRGI